MEQTVVEDIFPSVGVLFPAVSTVSHRYVDKVQLQRVLVAAIPAFALQASMTNYLENPFASKNNDNLFLPLHHRQDLRCNATEAGAGHSGG